MPDIIDIKHKKLPREEITPEYIAKIRAIRRERHEREQRDLELKQLQTKYFIRRPILYIPNRRTFHDKPLIDLKIMTYNTLAQTLIRRTTFPDANEAIKWHNRSKVLMREIKFYHSDILCLQEVDKIQWERFWADALAEVDYKGEFFTYPGKVHGVAIAWNTKVFEDNPISVVPMCLDKIVAGNEVPTTTRTRSVALIVALKLRSTNQNYNSNKSNGVLVGTTHLFWHLFGTFERTRQCYIIMDKLNQVRNQLISSNVCNHWYTFLTGDFNSQPCDPPYLSITEKPVQFYGRPKAIIECSTSYQYSKRRNGELVPDMDSSSSNEDEGISVRASKHRKHAEEEDEEEEPIPENQPTEPRPYTFDATPEQSAMVQKIVNLHNTVPLKAVSLYGIGYHLVHPENSNPTTNNSEPELSHRSIKWSGLLDYIFVIKSWNSTNSTNGSDTPETVDTLERDCHLHIKGYLMMPLGKDMPNHTEPHTGEYPSDHLAMMCEVSLEK